MPGTGSPGGAGWRRAEPRRASLSKHRSPGGLSCGLMAPTMISLNCPPARLATGLGSTRPHRTALLARADPGRQGALTLFGPRGSACGPPVQPLLGTRGTPSHPGIGKYSVMLILAEIER